MSILELLFILSLPGINHPGNVFSVQLTTEAPWSRRAIDEVHTKDLGYRRSTTPELYGKKKKKKKQARCALGVPWTYLQKYVLFPLGNLSRCQVDRLELLNHLDWVFALFPKKKKEDFFIMYIIHCCRRGILYCNHFVSSSILTTPLLRIMRFISTPSKPYNVLP